MSTVVILLHSYSYFLLAVMLVYSARHFAFTFFRCFTKQKIAYDMLVDSVTPSVTVIVPMHNEELVAKNILENLLHNNDGSFEFEIIAVNDHSNDNTASILDDYAAKHPCVKALHRSDGNRGKPNGLNDAIKMAKGDVIVVFDADYLPPKGIIKNLAKAFKDPEISSVMGRVVPVNESKNLLTRLIALERSGGYQVDQQARYSLDLLPQYGGTVGGFRKEIIRRIGGFDPQILAEDTFFTFKCALHGWKVQYSNKAECYEEVPEEWSVRARQIQRWSRGHNQVMLQEFGTLWRNPYMTPLQKWDAYLLLCIYFVPALLLLGIFVSLGLFFLGELNAFLAAQYSIFLMAYYGFGNFAPFYQISTASLLDGDNDKIKILPLMGVKFLFSMLYSCKGFIQALRDRITKRTPQWVKTTRYR